MKLMAMATSYHSDANESYKMVKRDGHMLMMMGPNKYFLSIENNYEWHCTILIRIEAEGNNAGKENETS